MSYKDLVQLCKKIGNIHIPNKNGIYDIGSEYLNIKYSAISMYIWSKDNKINKLVMFYLRTETSPFIVCIDEDHLKIVHNSKEIIIEYNILDEEYDDTYLTLKYGRYDLGIHYNNLLCLYYYLESKY